MDLVAVSRVRAAPTGYGLDLREQRDRRPAPRRRRRCHRGRVHGAGSRRSRSTGPPCWPRRSSRSAHCRRIRAGPDGHHHGHDHGHFGGVAPGHGHADDGDRRSHPRPCSAVELRQRRERSHGIDHTAQGERQLDSAEWRAIALMALAVVGLHGLGFFLSIAVVAPHHYAIGRSGSVRHRHRPDRLHVGSLSCRGRGHPSAIDNTTLELMVEGKRPTTVGFSVFARALHGCICLAAMFALEMHASVGRCAIRPLPCTRSRR